MGLERQREEQAQVSGMVQGLIQDMMVAYHDHCSISLAQFNVFTHRDWIACCHAGNYRLGA